jgi:DNA-binding MarR family transcriptional regulator
VDRLVAAGLVRRNTDPADRRQITLTLTEHGQRLSAQIATVEQRLYRRIDELTQSTHVQETLTLLRKVASAFPAGQAVARRRDQNSTTAP